MYASCSLWLERIANQCLLRDSFRCTVGHCAVAINLGVTGKNVNMAMVKSTMSCLYTACSPKRRCFTHEATYTGTICK